MIILPKNYLKMQVSRKIILLVLIVHLGCKKPAVTFTMSNGTLIENVTIISANKEGQLVKGLGNVLIDKGLIIYSGKEKPITTGPFKTIDASGKFLIPGLIDSHVHLANIAGMNWQNQKNNKDLVRSYFTQLPKSYLYYGYTTLIDVNNYAPNIVAKIKKFEIVPDIYTLGQQIQVMHDFMMEMEELPLKNRLDYPFLYDKYNNNLQLPDSIRLEEHSPKAIISAIVERQHGIGAKIAYEDESMGFLQSWELPSLGLMKDVIKQTKKFGVPLVMHAPSYEGQKFGLQAGIDIFAHPMWSWYRNTEQFLDTVFTVEHQRVLEEIAVKGVGNQLTFRAIYGEVDLFAENFMSDPALADVYPKEYLNWLKTEEANWGKQKILNRANIIKAINPNLYNFLRDQFDTDEAMFKGIQQVFTQRMQIVAKFLADRDANLLFGTDGVAMNMVTNPPGYNGFLEMKHWVSAGISLEKIFLAATFSNAKAFHLEDSFGTIEAGKVANLLLLNEDPILQISAYDEIHSVILHGVIHSRAALSAKANEIENK